MAAPISQIINETAPISSKRKASASIDLTGSDIENHAPAISKPIKKARTSTASIASVSSPTEIEGLSTDSVPVYETCDEIRKKIRAHLKSSGETQAAFLRGLATVYSDGRKPPQSKVLNDFLSKKGAMAGNTSAVFYASYVYFEKLRLAQGKPKPKHRIDMEGIYPEGMDVKRRRDHITVMTGSTWTSDQYGRVTVQPPRR